VVFIVKYIGITLLSAFVLALCLLIIKLHCNRFRGIWCYSVFAFYASVHEDLADGGFFEQYADYW